MAIPYAHTPAVRCGVHRQEEKISGSWYLFLQQSKAYLRVWIGLRIDGLYGIELIKLAGDPDAATFKAVNSG